MTSTDRSFLAFVALGLMACGTAGSGTGPGGSLGNSTGFGTSDPGPFSGTGSPGNQSGTTAGPSPNGSPGPYASGGGGAICDQLCAAIAQCVGGLSACLSGCAAEVQQIPCPNELAAVYRCAAPYIACGPDPEDKEDDSTVHFGEGATKACADAIGSYAKCANAGQGQGGAGGAGGSSSQGGGGKAGSGATAGQSQAEGGAAGFGGSGLGPQGGTAGFGASAGSQG